MFSKNLEASLGPAEAVFGAVAKADQHITCVLQPETLLQGSKMYPVLGFLVELICMSCIFLCDVYFEPEHEPVLPVCVQLCRAGSRWRASVPSGRAACPRWG